MHKISVILTTNRLNKNVIHKMNEIQKGLEETDDYNSIFTDEFIELAGWNLFNAKHILEPTLNCLESQTFKDFELIISHRYPEDAEELVREYQKECNFPIKLVKEKPSIWHKLGPQYQTVANNKNTGVINADGELIWHIDDLIIFNKYILEEIWNLWKEGKYMTGRSFRCIKYDKDKYNYEKEQKLGPRKVEFIKDGWRGEHKPLTFTDEIHPVIPMNMFWTCSATVSMEEMLEINGYDELYDGALAGIDMDAGNRLAMISKYKRVASQNYIYEIDDPAPKPQIRDDIMMRNIFRVKHIRANSWKPSKIQLRRYKMWHNHNKGELDPNWNKFMDVPMYNIKDLKWK